MSEKTLQDISKICNDKLSEKTSYANASNRLQQELDYIAKDEVYAEVFAVASELVSYSRELGYYTGLCGCLGSSLVAFLLGITEINPLKYNLPVEVFMGTHNEPLDIDLMFDVNFIPILIQYVRENYPNIAIIDRGEVRPTWLVFRGDATNWNTYEFDRRNVIKLAFSGNSYYTALKELSDMTGVDIFSISFDDKQTIELLKTDGIGYDDKEPDEPELWRRSFTRMVNPKTFEELVQTAGWDSGTYTCEQKDIPSMPAFREDVFLYLLHSGIDGVTAYEIMECVRKGHGLVEKYVPKYISAMTNAGIPKQYIDKLNQVRYLFPKAHCIALTMTEYRIAWFKAHYPDEFHKVMKMIQN